MGRRNPAVDEAVRLVAEGMTVGAAAKAAGCTPGGVWKRLNPERAREFWRAENDGRTPAKRAWANAHRAPCESCGQPMSEGSLTASGARRLVVEVCPRCQHWRRVELLREMVRLRREHDLSNRAIAAQIKTTPATVAAELSRCRAMGLDVPLDPYNRPPGGYRTRTASRDSLALGEADVRALVDAFPELADRTEEAVA